MTAQRTAVIAADRDWQQELKLAIRSVDVLLEALSLTADDLQGAYAAARDFPVRVPGPFLRRIRAGDPNDPLLKQVLSSGEETSQVTGYSNDPLEERAHNPLPGLIHKYDSRVLLMPTAACAVHCRYCFRRHFPYADNRLDSGALDAILAYLRQHPGINEVILSGGDPLIIDDDAMDGLISRLEQLPQLSRLRIHSRLPIVIPGRLTTTLAERLRDSRLNTVLVVHCNHANEIDAETSMALHAWRDRGITLLNQAVLLQGVNDTVTDQVALAEAVFDAGVLPYYLHVLDPVAGTAHFDVSDGAALQIHAQMRDALPGFLLPRLVREVPGERAKRNVVEITA